MNLLQSFIILRQPINSIMDPDNSDTLSVQWLYARRRSSGVWPVQAFRLLREPFFFFMDPANSPPCVIKDPCNGYMLAGAPGAYQQRPRHDRGGYGSGGRVWQRGARARVPPGKWRGIVSTHRTGHDVNYSSTFIHFDRYFINNVFTGRLLTDLLLIQQAISIQRSSR